MFFGIPLLDGPLQWSSEPLPHITIHQYLKAWLDAKLFEAVIWHSWFAPVCSCLFIKWLHSTDKQSSLPIQNTVKVDDLHCRPPITPSCPRPACVHHCGIQRGCLWYTHVCMSSQINSFPTRWHTCGSIPESGTAHKTFMKLHLIRFHPPTNQKASQELHTHKIFPSQMQFPCCLSHFFFFFT